MVGALLRPPYLDDLGFFFTVSVFGFGGTGFRLPLLLPTLFAGLGVETGGGGGCIGGGRGCTAATRCLTCSITAGSVMPPMPPIMPPTPPMLPISAIGSVLVPPSLPKNPL